MIFESHAHYDDDAFNLDRHELLAQIFDSGVDYIVNVCADMSSMDSCIELTRRYRQIYCSLGVHPSEVYNLTDQDMSRLRRNCEHDKVVAIGEIGLDYHYPDTDKVKQKKWFERQILIAQEEDLPIIIHSRDAAQDTVDMMRYLHAEETGGVLHCYSYSREMAAQFMRMDFYFGIGGVVTYKNAKNIREVVEYIPINRILLETDCPYLSPEPHRGERNSSLNLHYIAGAIAEIKHLDYEKVLDITRENAKRLFRIY